MGKARLIIAAALGFGVAIFVFFAMSQLTWNEPVTVSPDSEDLILERLPDDKAQKACKKSDEERVSELIAEAKNCRTDQDCVVGSFGCPFGCFTAVNSASLERITLAAKAYQTGCFGCKYRCKVRTYDSVCVEGQCELERPYPELSSNTPLERALR